MINGLYHWIPDILGWTGFAILMYAYTRKAGPSLRIWTVIACIFLASNAFLISSWPFFALQLVAGSINAYKYFFKFNEEAK